MRSASNLPLLASESVRDNWVRCSCSCCCWRCWAHEDVVAEATGVADVVVAAVRILGVAPRASPTAASRMCWRLTWRPALKAVPPSGRPFLFLDRCSLWCR